MEVPRLVKIGLNMGVGEAKTSTPVLEAADRAAGRRSRASARTSAAPQVDRQLQDPRGDAGGVAVTLRGARMWEFLDRLITIAIPRIRDFRGLNPRSFDGRGNYTLGIREQLIFPEIDYDSIDEVRGLDVTIATRADRRGGVRAPARPGHAILQGGRARGRGRGGAAAEEERRHEEARLAPRPSRPRWSSSRPRTPRPTRSRRSPRRARKARRARAVPGRGQTAEAESSEESE